MTPSAYSPLALRRGKSAQRAVLDGGEPRAQRADVAAAWDLGGLQHLRPGVDRIAGEAGRHVPAAVDGGDVEGVGEAVERQRAGERDDDAAVDEPPLELALRLLMQVEVHLGRVLVEPGGDLVLGLLQRHGVGVVDLLADGVVAPAMRRAGEREVVARHVELRHGLPEAAPDRRARRASAPRARAPATPVSRLRTITQRTYSSTVSPCWLRPVVRT